TQGGDAVVVQRIGEPGHEGVLHPGAGPVREDQRGERVVRPGVEPGDLEIADADGYGGLGYGHDSMMPEIPAQPAHGIAKVPANPCPERGPMNGLSPGPG